MAEGGESVEDENRRLARLRLGARDEETVFRDEAWTASRHLLSGRSARRDSRRGRDVHVFFPGADLYRLERLVWLYANEGSREVRDWRRFWLRLGWQIGERLQRGRPVVALYVVEIKARIEDGRWEYHLVPRASKAMEVLR